MPPTLNFWRSFLRWRSGRGFGIHSPFAYRFVTEVLHQPCAFYAYDRLGPQPQVRLMVRLMAAFRPRRVALVECGGLLRQAVRMADSRVPVSNVTEGADLVAVDCSRVSPEAVEAMLCAEPRPHALLLNCPAPPQLQGYGMTFANARGTVVVASYKHLPRQDFEVRF